ncbi:AlpA family transcriptional regulator [Corynebacterium sp. HMSC05E07]|uniref:helix-turn-helix transcriptional regulator n=1 Tax=Corynebacterium sp. HMSC05E07 TaxID=1581117 RepID=UPI0008A5C983|nr:helix-turn-helix domain-containing protein [Corynebacterium sp. HMSC05E07]OFT59859.1 hypothetical protein HMPREF3149_09235 [Corynebacterium sp. HMSC05E07]
MAVYTDLPELLTTEDLIDLAPASSPWVWKRLRAQGGGPRFIYIGRRVYYPREEFLTWLDANLSTVTN